MRILVTGSRSWTDEDAVEAALREAWIDAGSPVQVASMTLVHGACPTGADAIADRIARRVGMQVEPHPADWERHGRSAGPIRNAEMVVAGADVCLAFIAACTSPRCREPRPHPSHGATHCADLSTAAGIEVRRYTPREDE